MIIIYIVLSHAVCSRATNHTLYELG